MGLECAPFSDAVRGADRAPDTALLSVTLRLSGELDMAAVPHLNDRLREADRSGLGSDVLVDLSEVTFMDCSALTCLPAADRRLGDNLRLHDATPPRT